MRLEVESLSKRQYPGVIYIGQKQGDECRDSDERAHVSYN